MSIVRCRRDLPEHLSTVQAWRDRLRNEDRVIVLADAYEYNLWHLDEDGVARISDHPLHDTTPENFLHDMPKRFNWALIEVMRRRGLNIYERLIADAEAAGLTDEQLAPVRAALARINEQRHRRLGA